MPGKKIGLMGCGVVAEYGHAPVLRATEGLTLHALFDPSPARLALFSEKFGVDRIRCFTDVEAFFGSGIDAVSITSPAPVHESNVLDACRHGKHVLCEKPLAMNVEECQRMVAAAEQSNIQLFTAFDYRFSLVSQQIHQLIRDGAIGRVGSLRLIYIWNLHGKWSKDAEGNRVANQRRIGRMLEGGPMVDCGVHQIDLARWWLGSEVVGFSSSGAWVDEFEAPDHLYLHMDHACGAHTMVEISYSYCFTAEQPISTFTYEIIGSEGVIRYDRNARTFELRNNKGTQQLAFAGEKNFAGMYAAFSQALQTSLPGNLPTGHDGLEATRISRQATVQAIEHRLKSRVLQTQVRS